MDIPDFSYFKERWNMLAKDNGLSGFYFIANSEDITDLNKEELKNMMLYPCVDYMLRGRLSMER